MTNLLSDWFDWCGDRPWVHPALTVIFLGASLFFGALLQLDLNWTGFTFVGLTFLVSSFLFGFHARGAYLFFKDIDS